jgi:hypothetical protein
MANCIQRQGILCQQCLTKTTIPDFFTPEGLLKQDYKDVKPTLEATVDRMIQSYVNFISG